MLSGSLNIDEDLRYRLSSIVTIVGHIQAAEVVIITNEFRIIYSELYDVLCPNNEKYRISILLWHNFDAIEFSSTFYIAMFTWIGQILFQTTNHQNLV
jgi:hypothetical protein